jgi:HSP20 family molecular chaperone IbpA
MANRELHDWMALLSHEMGWLSGEMTSRGPMVARQRGWTPRVDLLEGDTFVLLRIELAGVSRTDLTLSYNADRNTIMIRGERREADLAHDCRCVPHLLEIEYGEFSREIRLPDGEISLEGVKTVMKCGMLYVVIPKENDDRVRLVVEQTITIFST